MATHADGSQKTTYSHFLGQTMLTDLVAVPATPSDGRWIDYTLYDATSFRPYKVYSPAAINMAGTPYDNTSCRSPCANEHTGLVNISGYVGVTVGSLTIKGFLASTAVQGNGLTSPVPVSGLSYHSQASGSAAIVLVVPRRTTRRLQVP